MSNTDTKTCTICGIEKSINSFYTRNDANSRRSECKECGLKKKKKWVASLSDQQKKDQNKNRREWFYRKSNEEREVIKGKMRIKNLPIEIAEKIRIKGRIRYAKNKERKLFGMAKRRANKEGLEFNIDIEDIIIPDICPVLDIPIIRDFNGTRKNMGPSDNSPSLDRIDNTKGYVKGNVCVISYKANNIKNRGTSDDHRKIANYIDKFAPSSQK